MAERISTDFLNRKAAGFYPVYMQVRILPGVLRIGVMASRRVLVPKMEVRSLPPQRAFASGSGVEFPKLDSGRSTRLGGTCATVTFVSPNTLLRKGA